MDFKEFPIKLKIVYFNRFLSFIIIKFLRDNIFISSNLISL